MSIDLEINLYIGLCNHTQDKTCFLIDLSFSFVYLQNKFVQPSMKILFIILWNEVKDVVRNVINTYNIFRV